MVIAGRVLTDRERDGGAGLRQTEAAGARHTAHHQAANHRGHTLPNNGAKYIKEGKQCRLQTMLPTGDSWANLTNCQQRQGVGSRLAVPALQLKF